MPLMKLPVGSPATRTASLTVFGHLHFVADVLLLLLALAFGGVGGVWIMRVLHPRRA